MWPWLRLLEVVQKRVDLVRSRAVKRVQWRLENAHVLRQYFAAGRPVCSTAFQAGGISGLQLVFYPSGSHGAREGFCSFFLSCPAGCTIRCRGPQPVLCLRRRTPQHKDVPQVGVQ